MSIEHQNAFALSMSEYKSASQAKRIEQLLSEGKFVVGYRLDIHCPFTDAFMNCEDRIVSIYDTFEDAQANYEENEISFLAEPKGLITSPVVVPDPDKEDCPF